MRFRILPLSLLAAGILIGIILSAQLRLLPEGKAVGAKDKPPSIAQAEQPFVEVAKEITPAVVNISSTRTIRGQEFSPFPFEDPFFRRFFGDEFFGQRFEPRKRKEQSLGSGVIVDPDGLIVTNNHVVSKADDIKVLLADRREFKGKIVGTDPKTDLAVVRIEAKGLPTAFWGDSSKLEVGEYVLAVGNPFGLNQTVTMGIVSAVGRANVGIADYEDFIQTDAAINPGNSGGALVNTRGELVGINTAIFTRSGGYMGIGFAVPSNMARQVMEQLVAKGKVVRGWLGISIQDVSPALAKEFGLKETRGALVSDVLSKSPAEKAGLKRGDVIVEIEGKAIENTSHLRNLVARASVGSKVKLKVVRDKQSKELEATIEEPPEEIARSEEEPEEGGEGENILSGLEVRNLTPDLARQLGISVGHGVVVTRIESDSPAEEAGLLRGDVILEVNRKPIKDLKEYQEVVGKIKKEEGVLLLINRQGRTVFITIAS